MKNWTSNSMQDNLQKKKVDLSINEAYYTKLHARCTCMCVRIPLRTCTVASWLRSWYLCTFAWWSCVTCFRLAAYGVIVIGILHVSINEVSIAADLERERTVNGTLMECHFPRFQMDEKGEGRHPSGSSNQRNAVGVVLFTFDEEFEDHCGRCTADGKSGRLRTAIHL